MGDTAERDLALSHDLEERRLHLGGRTVDLVRQHEVGEDGAELDVEALRRLSIHPRPDDVRGEEIGRELDPGERPAECAGEGRHGERLSEPGNPLEQAVATGEQGHEHTLEDALLTDDHSLQLRHHLTQLHCVGHVGVRLGRQGRAGWGTVDGGHAWFPPFGIVSSGTGTPKRSSSTSPSSSGMPAAP